LTTCGKRVWIIGEHIIRLVAIGGALTGMLYSQPPPIACSNVLSDKSSELGLLHRDASRSSPHPHNGGFEYRSFSHFQYWGSYSTSDGLAPGGLWASPFSSYQEGSANSCGSDLRADRTGDSSVSTENDGSFRSLGLAEGNLWAEDHQSPPSAPIDAILCRARLTETYFLPSITFR
jgi:hypothetical protein